MNLPGSDLPSHRRQEKQHKIYEDLQGVSSASWHSYLYSLWVVDTPILHTLQKTLTFGSNSSLVDLKVKQLEFEFKFHQLDKLSPLFHFPH